MRNRGVFDFERVPFKVCRSFVDVGQKKTSVETGVGQMYYRSLSPLIEALDLK